MVWTSLFWDDTLRHCFACSGLPPDRHSLDQTDFQISTFSSLHRAREHRHLGNHINTEGSSSEDGGH